jgi:hypothetical protein
MERPSFAWCFSCVTHTCGAPSSDGSSSHRLVWFVHALLKESWKGDERKRLVVREQGSERNDCAGRIENVEEKEHLMASVLFGITNEGSDIGIFVVVEKPESVVSNLLGIQLSKFRGILVSNNS